MMHSIRLMERGRPNEVSRSFRPRLGHGDLDKCGSSLRHRSRAVSPFFMGDPEMRSRDVDILIIPGLGGSGPITGKAAGRRNFPMRSGSSRPIGTTPMRRTGRRGSSRPRRGANVRSWRWRIVSGSSRSPGRRMRSSATPLAAAFLVAPPSERAVTGDPSDRPGVPAVPDRSPALQEPSRRQPQRPLCDARRDHGSRRPLGIDLRRCRRGGPHQRRIGPWPLARRPDGLRRVPQPALISKPPKRLGFTGYCSSCERRAFATRQARLQALDPHQVVVASLAMRNCQARRLEGPPPLCSSADSRSCG